MSSISLLINSVLSYSWIISIFFPKLIFNLLKYSVYFMRVAVKMPMFDFIVGIIFLEVFYKQKLTNTFVLIKIINTQEKHLKTLHPPVLFLSSASVQVTYCQKSLMEKVLYFENTKDLTFAEVTILETSRSIWRYIKLPRVSMYGMNTGIKERIQIQKPVAWHMSTANPERIKGLLFSPPNEDAIY